MKTGNIEVFQNLRLKSQLQDESGANGVTVAGLKQTVDTISILEAVTQKNEDNIMLNAFRIQAQGSLTVQHMVDGFTDEYVDESGIDLVNSVNQNYLTEAYTPLTQGIDSNTKLMIQGEGYPTISHTITVNGNTQITTTQKKVGSSCLYLDGTGDYLSLSDSSDWSFGTADFTLDFWVRFESTQRGSFISQGDGTADNWWKFEYTGGGNIEVYFAIGGAVQGRYQGVWAPNTAQWYHLAFVRSGTTGYIFIDGVDISATEINAFSTNDVGNISGALNIGRDTYITTRTINGWMDELRISKGIARWTSGFTPQAVPYTPDEYTVLLIHSEGTQGSTNIVDDVGGDSSGTYKKIIYYGDCKISTSTKKFGIGSLSFDGTGDYIDLADSADWDIFGSSSDSWTIDFWVYHNTVGTTQNYIAHYSDASNFWKLTQTSGNLTWYSSIGVSTGASTSTPISTGSWIHIACCKVASLYAVYVNGVQVNYTSNATTGTFTNKLVIGSFNGGQFLNGFIDSLRVQHSNYFNASPNVGLTDSITVPTGSYSTNKTNMTLQSETVSAASIPNSGRLVLLEEDVDTITLNTDLKAYASRDNGSTWDQTTLEEVGYYDTIKRILVGDFDFSGVGSGSSLRYKLVSDNNKDLKLHATSLAWD